MRYLLNRNPDNPLPLQVSADMVYLTLVEARG